MTFDRVSARMAERLFREVTEIEREKWTALKDEVDDSQQSGLTVKRELMQTLRPLQ